MRTAKTRVLFVFSLVNGVLQVLLQPLGLGVDAHFPVVLQLGTAERRN